MLPPPNRSWGKHIMRDGCPRCTSVLESYGMWKDRPKYCSGRGIKIFGKRFGCVQAIPHFHYKCWQCNLKYMRSAVVKEENIISTEWKTNGFGGKLIPMCTLNFHGLNLIQTLIEALYYNQVIISTAAASWKLCGRLERGYRDQNGSPVFCDRAALCYRKTAFKEKGYLRKSDGID